MRRLIAIPLLLMAAAAVQGAVPDARVTVVPYRAPARLKDAAELLQPDDVRLEGFLGRRVTNNEKNRLLEVDEEELLAGFRHRPGKQAWIGEHVGKFLHAATLAWVNTGDPALRAKIDRVAAELIKTQEPNGYLGTYTPETRFGQYPNADWDVWVHKYDLIGLLTYYHYTGNRPALEACRKVGDLLIATFGPGKKSINSAGTHMGMAATSVLEPTVLLYRTTGDSRYLDFAKYIVSAWDEPKGPHVLSTLLTEKSVAKTANGKAYEMLSNLVGLCELARATGERRYIEAAENAWSDVVNTQLYITGTASHHEHFHLNYDMPNSNGANLGETCVTVTWIQLNAQLLRLTGDAKYGDELERSYYNHLAGAQEPDGAKWCYYTPLTGTKPYGNSTNCCLSSGPRGMAMAPQLTYLRYPLAGKDGLAVNLLETSDVKARLGGQTVMVRQETEFPARGVSTLTIRTAAPATFGLRVRSPQWAEGRLAVRLMRGREAGSLAGGWVTVSPRRWKDGDQVEIRFPLPARVVAGEHGNAGRSALTWGPLVLAYDQKLNPGLPINRIALADAEKPPVRLKIAAPGDLEFSGTVRTADGQAHPAVFVPFARAGQEGSRFEVWMRAAGTPFPQNSSLLSSGSESRSREGNATGSIIDGDPSSHVVTFENTPRAQDWFAVTLDEPAAVRRVTFAHGHSYHDGGWFDASAGKPRVQAQLEKGARWTDLGTLDDYPATTAADPRGLKDGQTFTLRLSQPVRVVAVRVIGKPSSGDNPNQAFASCGELQAFAD